MYTQEEKHISFSAKTIRMPSSGGSGGKEDEETVERTKSKTMMGMGGAITPAVVCSPQPRRPPGQLVKRDRWRSSAFVTHCWAQFW